jgi:HK97 gp10 family phage protein
MMKWNGAKVTLNVKKAMLRALARTAHDIRNDAINSITEGQKSGRTYTRRGIVHVASAPGEPPAADTGTLHNSIEVVMVPAAIKARVNASASYAASLELGTQKMQPRPYLNPALQKNIPGLKARIIAEVKRVT